MSFRDKRIDGFDFSDAKAKKNVTDFQRSAGEKPNFQGAQLPEVSFRNAVISEANFKNANLKKVTISGADIRNSNFKGADMEEADLYRATLLGSQFPNVNFKNARLDAMKVADETDFSKVDFTQASVMDVDLTRADLSKANLTNAYFSRSLMPYPRKGGCPVYKHIGIYAYRRDFLLKYARMEPTPLEKAESLEQLRALENGYRIKVVETKAKFVGVDTVEDLARVNEIYRNM
jgi:hypothetical protein